MPRVSYFDGISIYIYYDEPHGAPHFQALYQGRSMYIETLSLASGKVGPNSFSPRAWRKVRKWAAFYQEDLLAAWNARTRHQDPGRIPPLP